MRAVGAAGGPRVRGRFRLLVLALAACAALAAAAAAAPARRVEAIGASPAAQGRPAAIHAALDRAVLDVARSLLGGEATEGSLSSLLEGEAEDYVVRYRVLDDVGERRSLLLSPSVAEREYVIVVEAYVDRARIEAELRERGRLAAPGLSAPLGEFRLLVAGPASYRAIAALSDRLRELGASEVVPTSFTAERTELQVRAPVGPEALLDRLMADPPAGTSVIPLAQDAGELWLRLREQAAPLPAEPSPGASHSPRIDTR